MQDIFMTTPSGPDVPALHGNTGGPPVVSARQIPAMTIIRGLPDTN